jgi:hypothetical protein
MRTDEVLSGLSTEARWHTLATALVLPLLLTGMVTVAVLAFGALEMGLATAQRRPLLLPLGAGRSARRAQPS